MSSEKNENKKEQPERIKEDKTIVDRAESTVKNITKASDNQKGGDKK